MPVEPYLSYEGDSATVSGFGWEEMEYAWSIPKENPEVFRSFNGTTSYKMKFGKVTVLNNTSCEKSIKRTTYTINSDVICAEMFQDENADVEGVSTVFIIL